MRHYNYSERLAPSAHTIIIHVRQRDLSTSKSQERVPTTLSLCFPHVDLHLAVEAVVEQQVVRHADAVRLHGVALAVVVVANVP